MNKRVSYVCVSNAHVLVSAVSDSKLRRIINEADYNVPDGMPIVWFARHILGLKHVGRVTGPALMNKCFDELREFKHFLYGSTRETLDKIEALAKQKSNVNIVGSFSPPFKPLNHKEKDKIISMINEISPDIIWVGLGAPKQEWWMHEMRSELKKGVMIGVGAAFDYFAGNIKRPSVRLRRFGFEWVYRLCQEPKRLWKRYLITNSLMLIYLLKELLSVQLAKLKGK